MIINVCLNDNQASRAFRKSSKFCEQCGKPYVKVSVYAETDEKGNIKLVTGVVRDEPPPVLEEPENSW